MDPLYLPVVKLWGEWVSRVQVGKCSLQIPGYRRRVDFCTRCLSQWHFDDQALILHIRLSGDYSLFLVHTERGQCEPCWMSNHLQSFGALKSALLAIMVSQPSAPCIVCNRRIYVKDTGYGNILFIGPGKRIHEISHRTISQI